MPPLLCAPSVRVYCQPTDGGAADRLVDCLDEEERARADRFRADANRRAYICAHGLLRRALTDAQPDIPPTAWRFDRDPQGKPFVRPPLPDLAFSLTHCNGMAACAVAPTDGWAVGVDAESLARRASPLALAERFFAADEAAELAALENENDRRASFLRLWTLKEALVKASGTGIAGSLQAFSFHALKSSPCPALPCPTAVSPTAVFHDPALGRVDEWLFRRWDVPGRVGQDFSVALALRHGLAPERAAHLHIDLQISEPTP